MRSLTAFRTMTAGIALLVGLTQAVSAQTTAPDAVRSPRALADGVGVELIQPGAGTSAAAVDETALRYFAQKGDRPAVEAEIARLKAQHPDWQPPDDLFATGPRVDERPLWALYEAKDFAGVREAITKLQADHPQWSPPPRLVQLMEVHEVRGSLERLEAAKDWPGIIAYAAQHPGQLTCANVDNLWRLAEAQSRTANGDAALGTYRRVLEQCESFDVGLATIQKAKLLLPADQIRPLAGLLEGRAPDAAAAARLKESVTPPTTGKAAGAPAPQQSPLLKALYAKTAGPAQADAAAALVAKTRDAAAARKIGWINYEAKRFADAADWFRRAQGWRRSSESVRGLALSLAELRQFAELDQLALAHPAIVQPIIEERKGGRLAKALADEDYGAILRATANSEAPDQLLVRGWALMELERPAEALGVFNDALARATTAGQQQDGSYGLARAYLALGAWREAAPHGERLQDPARRAEVMAEVIGDQAVAAYNAKDYRVAAQLLASRRAFGKPDRQLDMLEGWSRYNLGHLSEADYIFGEANRLYGTEETRKALAVVRERRGVGLN